MEDNPRPPKSTDTPLRLCEVHSTEAGNAALIPASVLLETITFALC